MTPGPALVYRTIGGLLDLYFFMGPTPNEVGLSKTSCLVEKSVQLSFFQAAEQYASAVGNKMLYLRILREKRKKRRETNPK